MVNILPEISNYEHLNIIRKWISTILQSSRRKLYKSSRVGAKQWSAGGGNAALAQRNYADRRGSPAVSVRENRSEYGYAIVGHR